MTPRASRSALLAAVFSLLLGGVVAAQDEEMLECKRCDTVMEILLQVNCDGCVKAPKESCDPCAEVSTDLGMELTCMACMEKNKQCEACKKFDAETCGECAASKIVKAAIFCCAKCKEAKKVCDKCTAARTARMARIKCTKCKAKTGGNSATLKDVTVTATKIGSELKGWFKFKVVAVNASKDKKKTFTGKLVLSDGGGEATLSLQLDVGATVEKEVTVKVVKEGWKGFEVVATSVLDKWLD